MVVFTCGHCGESVQKPKVEKHYQTKCRNRTYTLSCMDCFKDFVGNEYESHIKCVTEEERYAGKGFVAKEKKGEKKQQTWIEMLQSVLEEHKDISGNVHRIIDTVSKQCNTPRKKPKFINFVKNCCGQKTNLIDIEQAWDLISVKLTELSNQYKNQKNENVNSNGTATNNGNVDTKGSADVDTHVGNGLTKDGEYKKENPVPLENGAQNQTNGEVNGVENKKLSKKQKKEEKKRRKYEAELQSAVAPPVEDEEAQVKKGKKKKNRAESLTNADVEDPVQADGKGKHKKRKRQDTVNAPDVVENDDENIEPEPVNKEKTQKKKLKVTELGSTNESICFHDENVAKTEEEPVKNGKFDWHSAILSVLEKKGQEVPFKRLQKKVLAEFVEMTGQDVDDRIADKFIKKLKSAPNVKVDKNRVFIQQ